MLCYGCMCVLDDWFIKCQNDQLLTNNLQHWSVMVLIYQLSLDCLFFNMETVMTFLVVPQAVPRAFLDSTNTQGTFCITQQGTFYSQRMGKWSTISRGLASAAMMINSVIPLLRVLVASLAPFLICLSEAHCETKSQSSEDNSSVARGWALSGISCITTFVPLLLKSQYYSNYYNHIPNNHFRNKIQPQGAGSGRMNLQVIFYFQLSIIGLKQFKMLNEDFTVIVQNLHRPINCLIDQDRNIRKSGLQTILKEIPKIHKHHQTKILLTTHLNKNLLHTLSDPIEANREISLQILQLIFEQAELKKQQTDPFIIGLINRINTTPFPEKSEDIRLRIVNLMKKCISFKQSYAGNMTELTNALSKCLDDDNGEMKIATCELINLLSKEFKTVIGKHSTSITKSLSDNINHRKFIVRKNVLITISNLLSTDGAGGNFEHVQQKIKGILSDPKIEVRKAAYECIASITKCIAPKYLKQYEAILVSFLLSGLSDESAENIGLCIKLLEECGESIKELYGEETEG